MKYAIGRIEDGKFVPLGTLEGDYKSALIREFVRKFGIFNQQKDKKNRKTKQEGGNVHSIG